MNELERCDTCEANYRIIYGDRAGLDEYMVRHHGRCINPSGGGALQCSRCGDVLSRSYVGDFDACIATHHAVCPSRPVEVGDYVRWLRVGRDLWADGELLSVTSDRGICVIRVTAQGGEWCAPLAKEQRFDGPYWESVSLRRIPRPTPEVRGEALPLVEAPKFVDRPCCMGCGRLTQLQHLDARLLCHENRRLAHLTAPVVHRDVKPENVPQPTLHDGLTAGQCLFRWWDNRALLERGAPLLYDMTPAQIAVAKAEHAMETGQSESARLRAKLAESRERDRNRVVVDLQDEP